MLASENDQPTTDATTSDTAADAVLAVDVPGADALAPAEKPKRRRATKKAAAPGASALCVTSQFRAVGPGPLLVVVRGWPAPQQAWNDRMTVRGLPAASGRGCRLLGDRM